MRYVHSFTGGIVAFIIFLLVAFFVPQPPQLEDVEIILTVSTFLFAILSGFYISRLNRRYEDIKRLLATEDANFLSLYELSSSLGKKLHNQTKALIEKYYVIIYDYLADKNYYKHTAKTFHEMHALKSLIPNGAHNLLYDDFLANLTEIERDRNTSSELMDEHLTAGSWSVLALLGAVILYSLFTLMGASFGSAVVFSILATALALVFLIMRDLQNLNLGRGTLAVESGQEILDAMGVLRYYNKEAVDSGFVIIPKHVKKYRLGVHKPGKKANVKIVKNVAA